MRALRELLDAMEKAKTMAEMNRLVKAFEAEALRLEEENRKLKEKLAALKVGR